MTTEPFTPHADSIQTAWVLMCQQSRIATQPPVEELEAEFDRFLARVRRDAAREALDGLADAEHRATRAEAQSAIRGRAVAIYQQRAREAKERIQAVEDALDGYTKFIHVEHIRAALEAAHQETA